MHIWTRNETGITKVCGQLSAEHKESNMSIAEIEFLIVEDHDFQRRIVVRMLKGLGATAIHEARDGREALAVIQERQPTGPVQIVITDLDMPGMDGMEFLRHLGESMARVSVILTSALDRGIIDAIETMTKAYGIRLLGVLEKPLNPDKLQSLIGLYQPSRSAPDRTAAAAPAFTLEEILAGLRRDEFEPFFQPKIDLATRQIRGAEALARWRHPDRGLVAPHAFIDLLEDNDCIDELMWVMMSKSAAFCSGRGPDNTSGYVSVNLSLKSLGDVHLAERVTELVRGEGMEPRQMVLELTESAATSDIGHALENLARLRMKGFGLSIDDYGTGYSSMQQLMRIPFTELKIDRSFVHNAVRQESAGAILESSVGLARKLNLTVVAEGVETESEWEHLRHLGCDLAQGYFIAKPMPADNYRQWARDWAGTA